MQALARTISFVVVVVASSAPAGADVLTVRGTNPAYTDIQPAVTAAVDGDVILVRSGGYGAFTIDGKSISIVADTGATVGLYGPAVVQNISASQTVLIAGLKFNLSSVTSVKLQSNLGHVRIESVVATEQPYSGSMYPTVIVSQCADVSFASCTFAGPGSFWDAFGNQFSALPALVSSSSTLTFYDCVLDGGTGSPGIWDSFGMPVAGQPGAAALSGSNTSIFARGTVFQGGNGGNGLTVAGCAGGYSYPTVGGVGGAGISLQGASTGTLIASTPQGGTGGLGGSDACGYHLPQAPSGLDIDAPAGSVSSVAGPVLRFGVPQPAREGQNFNLHFEAPAGSLVLLLVGEGGAGYTNASALGGVLLIQSPLRRWVLGTIPASGTLNVLLPIRADIGVGLQSKLLHAQAIFIDTLGGSHLAGPGVLVMLDSAF